MPEHFCNCSLKRPSRDRPTANRGWLGVHPVLVSDAGQKLRLPAIA